MRVKSKRNLAVFAIALVVLIGTGISAAKAFGALDVSGAKSIAEGGSGEPEWKAPPHNGQHSSWESPGNGFTVPADYANKLKKAEDFHCESFGRTCKLQTLKDLYANVSSFPARQDSTHFCFDIQENSKEGCGIWLRNIMIYDNEEGKDVKLDCKLTIMDWADETKSTPEKHHVVLTKTKALPSIDIAGLNEVRLKWDYYRAGTENPYRVKSNVTFNDIDSCQYMGFKVEQAVHQFAHTNTALKFKSKDGYSLYTDPDYGNDEAMDPKQAFGVAYESDSILYTYGTLTNGTFSTFGELSYSMFRPMPNDPTKSVSDSDETEKKQVLLSSPDETITYNIQQVVANGYAPADYMKSFVMEDSLAECMEILSAKVQQNGMDSELFNITTEDHVVRAKAKESALKSSGFYNKTYNLVITAKLKKGITLQDLEIYKKGDMVAIPNTGTVIIDDTPRVTDEVKVLLWNAKPYKKVSDSDETNVDFNTLSSGKEPFVYTISQKIPEEVDSLSSLEFSDDVEACLEIKKVRMLENGADAGSKWSIRTEENQVKASTKDLGKHAAGKSYVMEITAQIKSVPDKLLQDHKHYSKDKEKLKFKNRGSITYGLSDGEEHTALTNKVKTELKLPTNIQITKRADQYEHQVGDPINYTVEITHTTGDCKATDLIVRDTDLKHFDLDLSEAQVTGAKTYTLKPVTGGWEFRTDELPQGKELSIQFTAKAKKVLNGRLVQNTALVKCLGVPEKSDKEEIYINSPKMKVVKKTEQDNYKTGDTANYEVELSQINKGCFMRNVILVDTIHTEGVNILPDTIKVMDKNGKDRTREMDTSVNGKTLTIQTKKNLSDKSEHIPAEEQGRAAYTDLDLTKGLNISYSAKITSAMHDSQIISRTEAPSCLNTNDELIKNDPDIPSGGAETEHKLAIVQSPAEAGLRIEKSADKKQYAVGETGLYMVKVWQTRKGSQAENVKIWDKFRQKGVIIDKESIKVFCNKNNITESCSISRAESSYEIKTNRDLPYGNAIIVTYKARFEAEELKDTEVTNTAAAKADNTKEKETDHTVQIGNAPASLELEKTSRQKTYEPGELLQYTVKAVSAGSGKAENVTIEDTLKTKGASFEPESICVEDKEGVDITKSCKVNKDGRTFSIETGKDLEPGEWIVLTYAAAADESLKGKEVENLAAGRADNAAEKKAACTVNIRDTSSGLQIVKESDKSRYIPNETIQYALTITATGAYPAKNVVIRDEIKTEGAVLDSECITIEDDKGTDLTKDCRIETTSSGFVIHTQQALETGRWLRVTYKAEADESLIGKDVSNLAAVTADNAERAEHEYTVAIDPALENLIETEPSSVKAQKEEMTLAPDMEERQEGLELEKKARVEQDGKGGKAQTGDESSMKLYVLLLAIAAAALILCMFGRRKQKSR